MEMTVKNLKSLGGKKCLVLFNKIGIFLLFFIRALKPIFIFFSITSEKSKDRIHFSINSFALKLFTKLRNDGDMMRFYFSSPSLIQRNMKLRNASRDNA